MIRLRDPYIKPPVIVDRLPEPVKLTSYVMPISGGLTITPNYVITSSSWTVTYPVNRFISASGYWHCASNWSLGHVPGNAEDVLISGVGQVYCLVHGDVHINDLTVANRVYLEIGAHAHVQAHTLTLAPNAWLNLADSQWTVSGDWNSGEGHVDGGTSTVTFITSNLSYTTTASITSTGVAFYGVVHGPNTS